MAINVEVRVVDNRDEQAGLDNLIDGVVNVGRVGWKEDAKYPETGELVVNVAIKQEFGGSSVIDGRRIQIPSRPFIRNTIAQHQTEWLDIMTQGAEAVVNDKITFDTVLDLVGKKAVRDIRNTVANRVPPPLAPITIARRIEKYSRKTRTVSIDLPLNDTGHMLATLTNAVEPE
jgi:hypothetical protein